VLNLFNVKTFERTSPGCPGRYGADCIRLGLCSHPIRVLMPPKDAGPADRRFGMAETCCLPRIEAHASRRFPLHPREPPSRRGRRRPQTADQP
jgi:hypothetical protein